MRDIKFRAWDKETKKIYEIENIYFQDEYASLIVGAFNEGNTIERKLEDIELMQYTGLNDKNGIPIFESDIVKRESENGVVKWDDEIARFRIYMDGNNPMPRNYPMWSELIEVIGNIYENSELLK